MQTGSIYIKKNQRHYLNFYLFFRDFSQLNWIFFNAYRSLLLQLNDSVKTLSFRYVMVRFCYKSITDSSLLVGNFDLTHVSMSLSSPSSVDSVRANMSIQLVVKNHAFHCWCFHSFESLNISYPVGSDYSTHLYFQPGNMTMSNSWERSHVK